MVRETFLCVKQIKHVLLARRKGKQQRYFWWKKTIIILSYSCLFLDEKMQNKVVWIQKTIKDLGKRNFEERILYVVRIKIRLNLIRFMNVVINSKRMQG